MRVCEKGFGRRVNEFSGFQSVESVQFAAKFPKIIIIIVLLLIGGCRGKDTAAEKADPEPGVPLTVATERGESIEGLSYDLAFTIPATPSDPINGRATIRFTTKDVTRPLILDFSPDADHIASVLVGGRPSHFRLVKDHIIIPNTELASDDNVVEIAFRAGEASLNRSTDFMYTLFVPA